MRNLSNSEIPSVYFRKAIKEKTRCATVSFTKWMKGIHLRQIKRHPFGALFRCHAFEIFSMHPAKERLRIWNDKIAMTKDGLTLADESS